ncbi:hypothetical protein BKA64DRAFT_667167, partial [Cadophora sp. MPI-SDFR-AT-0126]
MDLRSSDEVDRYRTVNAMSALRWMQKNSRTFGGSPREVTIFGESAGSERLMLQSTLYNGNLWGFI